MSLMSQTVSIVLAAVVVAVVAVCAFAFRAQAQSRPQGKADPAIYQDLRAQAFGGSRAAFGLPAGSSPAEPWGVIMDSSFTDGGSYTVVAIVDGSASIYLSSGGGFMGGIAHDNIRKAAKAMVNAGTTLQSKMAPTTSFPLPKGGETSFYLLTDAGLFGATASEQALVREHHALSPLFFAAQEVITQYRLINERKN